MRRGVPERLTFQGEVVTPLDEAALMRAVDELVQRGIRDRGSITVVVPMGVPLPPSPELSQAILRRYAEHIEDADYRQKMDEFLETQVCPDCAGTRLRPESRAVTVQGRAITTDRKSVV